MDTWAGLKFSNASNIVPVNWLGGFDELRIWPLVQGNSAWSTAPFSKFRTDWPCFFYETSRASLTVVSPQRLMTENSILYWVALNDALRPLHSNGSLKQWPVGGSSGSSGNDVRNTKKQNPHETSCFQMFSVNMQLQRINEWISAYLRYYSGQQHHSQKIPKASKQKNVKIAPLGHPTASKYSPGCMWFSGRHQQKPSRICIKPSWTLQKNSIEYLGDFPNLHLRNI